jgi:hypothetical protein
MGLLTKARTGTGWVIQLIGGLLWLGGGLTVLVWTLYVLFTYFGIWTIFVGLIFAPVTYVASILIVWFTTHDFPVIMLLPYVTSFIGMAVLSIGGKIKGED